MRSANRRGRSMATSNVPTRPAQRPTVVVPLTGCNAEEALRRRDDARRALAPELRDDVPADQLVSHPLRDLVRTADRFDITEQPGPSVQGGAGATHSSYRCM